MKVVADDVLVPVVVLALVVAWGMVWFHNGEKVGYNKGYLDALDWVLVEALGDRK